MVRCQRRGGAARPLISCIPPASTGGWPDAQGAGHPDSGGAGHGQAAAGVGGRVRYVTAAAGLPSWDESSVVGPRTAPDGRATGQV